MNEQDDRERIISALKSIDRQVVEAANLNHIADDRTAASAATNEGDARQPPSDQDNQEKTSPAPQSMDPQAVEAAHLDQKSDERTAAATTTGESDHAPGQPSGEQGNLEKVISALQYIDRRVEEAIHRNQNSEDRVTASKTSRFWVDIAAILVGLLAGFIFYRQQDSIKSQLTEIGDSVRQTAEFIRTDERAMVAISSINKTMQPHRDGYRTAFKYEFFLKNIGRTAADDMSVHAGYFVSPRAYGSSAAGIAAFQDRQLLGKTSASEINDADIVATSSVAKALARASSTPDPFVMVGKVPITPRDGVEIVSYLVGRIDYSDAFRVKHWLKFCYLVNNSDGELQNCAVGNDEDRTRETGP
jgi:hypothetical protein